MNVDHRLLSGKYKLLRLVGQGGMGSVYEAHHIDIDRPVAVKFLDPKLAKQRDARIRFEREAKAAGRINHDNVCEVLDFGADEKGNLYFVMPLLRGEPLNQIIKREGQPPISRCLDITVQILSALSESHNKQIIHRDLKPENIFLTTVGDRADFVKILDFGITKFPQSESDPQQPQALTRTGMVMGTPYYMSPEQARGIRDIDRRTDLYSVGVILYEMTTGLKPITGASVNEILWNIWNVPILPPKTHRVDIPHELEEIILNALCRDRDERYLSAEQFRDDLLAMTAFESSKMADQQEASTLPTVDASFNDGLQNHRQPQDNLDHQAQFPGELSSLSGKERTVDFKKKSSRLRKISLVAAAALLASATIGYFVVREFFLGPPEQSDVDVDLNRAVSQAMDSGPQSKNRDDARSDPNSTSNRLQKSRISFVGAPENAEITVDNKNIDRRFVEIPSSDKQISVLIRAQGYEDWQKQIPARKSAEIIVQMRALPTVSSRRTRKSSIKRSGKTVSRLKSRQSKSASQPAKAAVKKNKGTLSPVDFGQMP